MFCKLSEIAFPTKSEQTLMRINGIAVILSLETKLTSNAINSNYRSH